MSLELNYPGWQIVEFDLFIAFALKPHRRYSLQFIGGCTANAAG